MKIKGFSKAMACILCVCLIFSAFTLAASATSDYKSETHDVFKHTESTLAPGVEQSINYAYAKDGKQMVYYVATADISRDDVEVHSSYKDAQCTEFGMAKLTEQMAAADAKYTNPDCEYYNPYFTAVAGVNGDFYNMQTGRPSGAFVMDGVMSSTKANNRPFFAIMEDGTALCGANDTQWDAAVAEHGQVMEAVGGSQMLVVDGADVTASAIGSYNTDRHSRTMVGVTAEGKVVMAVLDGRQEPFSCGGTMHELAQIMLEQGCVSAINLDGGGSTTYAARQAGTDSVEVINRPSDGSERSISSGLLIASTAAPSNVFDHSVLTAENDYVTPGSAVNVSAVGVSPAGTSAEIPGDVTYTATLGTIENGVFTSDGTTGDAVVQMIYNGVVVGETTIHVVVPEKLAFDSDNITVPFGKTVELEMTATYGLNEVVLKPEDINFTLSESSVGAIDGFNLTAVEASDITSCEITAALVYDSSIVASANVNLGKGSEVLWDFEDQDVSAFARKAVGSYNYIITPGECSLADRETGKVHSGNYSMRVTSDFSVTLEAGYVNARLCFDDTSYELELNGATRFGMWVYIPDEAASLNGRIFLLEVTERDADGNPVSYASSYTVSSLIDDGGNWNVGFNTQYDESGWHYIYADIPAGGDYVIWDTILDYYINDRDNTNYNYNHLDYNSLNQNVILYIDDITLDYSSAVDDREAPQFTSVLYADTAMSDAAELNGQTVTDNKLSFSAKVQENTSKSNYTGLDESTAKAYVDGVEMPCKISNGIMSIADVTLADGLHKVKFSICDKQGNYASVIRQVNVQANSGIPTVKLVAHDPSLDKILLGSLYYTDLVATDIEKVQSVSVDLDLNNMSVWELDHMEVAEGFEATYTIEPDDKVATIDITRTGVNEATGEAVLVSMPIRTWELPAVEADYGHAGVVWMYPNYKSGNESWPIDISVKVDRGYVTYIDGTTDIFSGDDVQVDTESYVWDNETKPAEYASWNGGHDHRVETAQYYAEGASNVSTPITLPDKPATCLEDGYTGRTYCEECNSVVNWGTVLPATGHTYEIVDGVCKCKDCGELCSEEFDGKLYSDGLLVNGWVEDSYYVDGVKLTGVKEVEGYFYDFGDNGVCEGRVKYNGLIQDDSGIRYAALGELSTGWRLVGESDYYYFGDDYYAVSGRTENINGHDYTFNENGVLVKGSWYEKDGVTYYYWAGKKVQRTFFDIDGKTYYFGFQCEMVTGLHSVETGSNSGQSVIYLFGEDGALITEEGLHQVYDDIYYVSDGKPAAAGLVTDGTDYYYIRSTLKAVKGCNYYVFNGNGLMPSGYYNFDETGKMIIEEPKSGVIDENGVLHYYVDGALQTGLGLIELDGGYYYVRSGGELAVGNYYVFNGNDLMPSGYYNFDETGKMIIEEPKSGVIDENGTLYYYVDGVKQIGLGLIQLDGDYYYVRSGGELAVGNYYVWNNNGLMASAYYDFDETGKMIIEEPKNGVIDENGTLYYYVDGAKQIGLGLIQLDGGYYYVRSGGELAVGNYYVWNNNGLMASAYYDFDETGKMIIEEPKNGIIDENGTLYYYVDGAKQTGLGLIELDGGYYYVRSGGELAVGNYYVWNNNGLMASAYYDFDQTGKMIIEEPKNGIINENGTLYYYVDGVRQTGLGLIELDGGYYYVRSGGELAVGNYYVWNNNGIMASAYYDFDETGKMIIN